MTDTVGMLVRCSKCHELILVERGLLGVDHTTATLVTCMNCMNEKQQKEVCEQYNLPGFVFRENTANNRKNLGEIGHETVQIGRQGIYSTVDGEFVEIDRQTRKAVRETVLFSPAELYREQREQRDEPGDKRATTDITVTNETTFAAAKRLIVDEQREDTLLLNFASALHPGGGFLRGSVAQEEALARGSMLFLTLSEMKEYYQKNEECGTALYTDYLIYSPGVPIIRDDDHLLQQPYNAAMITAPAVNAGVVRQNEPDRVDQIELTMGRRIENVLMVANTHDHKTLVLGAWGCGVFGNDGAMIARLFKEMLEQYHFDRVVFAVYDRSDDDRYIKPFEECFAVGKV